MLRQALRVGTEFELALGKPVFAGSSAVKSASVKMRTLRLLR